MDKKKLIRVVVAVVIAVVIIVLYLMTWRGQGSDQKEADTANTQQSAQGSAAPEQKDDVTTPEETKSFTSEKYNYSFNYPASWQFESEGEQAEETLTLKSPEGETVKVFASPCMSQQECSIDGVYSGAYSEASDRKVITVGEDTAAQFKLAQEAYTALFKDDTRFMIASDSDAYEGIVATFKFK